MRPVGNTIPLLVSGLKVEGVVPFTTFRSNVSVWLGAPARRMKMTFFAVFRVVTGVELTMGAAGSSDASQEAVTPVPARVRKRRLERCGFSENVFTGCGYF